jgi:hypothetical protein
MASETIEQVSEQHRTYPLINHVLLVILLFSERTFHDIGEFIRKPAVQSDPAVVKLSNICVLPSCYVIPFHIHTKLSKGRKSVHFRSHGSGLPWYEGIKSLGNKADEGHSHRISLTCSHHYRALE